MLLLDDLVDVCVEGEERLEGIGRWGESEFDEELLDKTAAAGDGLEHGGGLEGTDEVCDESTECVGVVTL